MTVEIIMRKGDEVFYRTISQDSEAPTFGASFDEPIMVNGILIKGFEFRTYGEAF